MLDSSHRKFLSAVVLLDQSSRNRPSINWVAHKISCEQCNFVCYGQTERSLKTRVPEHKKVDHSSKVAPGSYVHDCYHQMDSHNVKVVRHEPHCHQRLFLEVWMWE